MERTWCFGEAERVAGLEGRDGPRCLWLDPPALARSSQRWAEQTLTGTANEFLDS